MLMNIASAMSSWLAQIFSIVSNQVTHMQPSQYLIGLTFCICVGYLLLRGRN